MKYISTEDKITNCIYGQYIFKKDCEIPKIFAEKFPQYVICIDDQLPINNIEIIPEIIIDKVEEIIKPEIVENYIEKIEYSEIIIDEVIDKDIKKKSKEK